MIVVWGNRLYGKLNGLGSVWMSTQFVYLQFLPFAPIKSFVFVGQNAFVLPLVGRSVAAGYFRAWGPVLAILGLIFTQTAGLAVGLLCVALGVGLGVWAWAALARPRGEARAKLEAYDAVIGAPVDPAYLVYATRHETGPLAKEWLATITRRAEETIDAEGVDLAASYRAPGRATDWRQIAERAQGAPQSCQRAALTLARIAWASSNGEAKTAAANAHDRIWAAMRG